MSLKVGHVIGKDLAKKPITVARGDMETEEIPLGHLGCRDRYDLILESHRLPCPIMEGGISGTVIGQYCRRFPEATVYVSVPEDRGEAA